MYEYTHISNTSVGIMVFETCVCSKHETHISVSHIPVILQKHRAACITYVQITVYVSAGKREQFVSDRVSYIVLRGRWNNIILLRVHAPSEHKSYGSKDSFCEELEQVF
jgi:hypothetical protein